VRENIQLEVPLADSGDLRRGSTVMYHNKNQNDNTIIAAHYNMYKILCSVVVRLKTWPRVWTCGRGVPKAVDEKNICYAVIQNVVIHCDRMINAHIIYIYMCL